MKSIIPIILIFICGTCGAFAAAPSTSCPSGYISITSDYFDITNDSCASGTTNVGAITSCLVAEPNSICDMYAPADIEYSDITGTYKFTGACPLQ